MKMRIKYPFLTFIRKSKVLNLLAIKRIKLLESLYPDVVIYLQFKHNKVLFKIRLKHHRKFYRVNNSIYSLDSTNDATKEWIFHREKLNLFLDEFEDKYNKLKTF